MSNEHMNAFSLRDTTVGEYRKFAMSFTTIHAQNIPSPRDEEDETS